MNHLKKLLIVVIFLVAALWVAQPFIADYVTDTVIAKSPVPVFIGKRQFQWIPLALTWEDIQVDDAKIQVSVQKVQIDAHVLSLFAARLPVHVRVESPKITLKGSLSAEETPKEDSNSSPGLPKSDGIPLRVPFVLEVSKLAVSHPAAEIRQTDINFEGLDLVGPWNLQINGELAPAQFPLALPVLAQIKLSREENIIAITDSQVTLLSVLAKANGKFDADKKSWQFNVISQVPDLAQIPVPQGPQLRGSVDLDVRASKEAAQGLSATWKIQLKKMMATVQAKKEGIELDGTVSVESNIAGEFKNNKLRLEASRLYVSAMGAALHYKDLFKKPKGTPFEISAQFQSDGNRLLIPDVTANVGAVMASGSLDMDAVSPTSNPVAMQVRIPTFNLSVLRDFLPMATRYAVGGSMELTASFSGLPTNPQAGEINVSKLNLTSFSLPLSLMAENKSWSLEGPIRGHITAAAKIKSNKVLSAQANGKIDATDLAVHYTDQLKKPKAYMAVFNFQGSSSDGESLNIQKMEAALSAGQLKLQGRSNLKPAFDIQIQSNGLDFAKLEQILPVMQPYGLRGSTSGQIQLRGEWRSKDGIAKSPIEARGEWSINLTKYVKKTEPDSTSAAPPSAAKGAAPATPEPLAPAWDIVKNSSVTLKLKANEIVFNDLILKNLSSSTKVDKGQLQSSAQFTTFGGDIKVSEFNTSVVKPWPDMDMKSQYSNVNLQQIVNWMAPTWKDSVKGQASGNIQMQMVFYKRNDFLDKFKAQGALNVKEGQFSSLKFQNLARQKLSGIPGVGNQNVKLDDLLVDMTSQFAVLNRVLNFQNLNLATPAKDELHALGTVGMDKSIDLKGTAYLTNAPVGGSIRDANLDGQGRFVVPLKIKGKLNDPELSFAQETVEQLLKNAAQFELKKLQKNPPKELQDLQKKAEEGLKNLFRRGG